MGSGVFNRVWPLAKVYLAKMVRWRADDVCGFALVRLLAFRVSGKSSSIPTQKEQGEFILMQKKVGTPSLKESSRVLAAYVCGHAKAEATLQCERQESNGFRIVSPWLRAVVLDLSEANGSWGFVPSQNIVFK